MLKLFSLFFFLLLIIALFACFVFLTIFLLFGIEVLFEHFLNVSWTEEPLQWAFLSTVYFLRLLFARPHLEGYIKMKHALFSVEGLTPVLFVDNASGVEHVIQYLFFNHLICELFNLPFNVLYSVFSPFRIIFELLYEPECFLTLWIFLHRFLVCEQNLLIHIEAFVLNHECFWQHDREVK